MELDNSLVVFSQWAIELEEIALIAFSHAFLEDKNEFAVFKCLQPLVPADLF